jgi:hypothetical protein
MIAGLNASVAVCQTPAFSAGFDNIPGIVTYKVIFQEAAATVLKS